jgi:hypothetical protein
MPNGGKQCWRPTRSKSPVDPAHHVLHGGVHQFLKLASGMPAAGLGPQLVGLLADWSAGWREENELAGRSLRRGGAWLI